jgi:hypothetical protein
MIFLIDEIYFLEIGHIEFQKLWIFADFKMQTCLGDEIYQKNKISNKKKKLNIVS